jgi:hypothetical protein
MIELTAYTKEGWCPRLRAAPRERHWMECSVNKSAYWCLPLSIANMHGWELLSPCAFRAKWDGRPGPNGVHIEIHNNHADPAAPVALFGGGCLTFHVAALFRTSPGYNLMVGGSPNRFKDGVQAMTGIIETDWAPYTFTMNWHFTRPDQWVHWDEDEPYCFFYPVPRTMIEQVQPRIVPFVEAPDIEYQHDTWSRSRNEFQASMRSRPPILSSEQWQKDYMRGLTPDNNKQEDHQTKLRLREFAKRV